MTSTQAAPVSPLAHIKDQLAACDDLKLALEVALDAAIELHAADFGSIQLYRAGALFIAAQRGFTAQFLETFRRVGVDDDCACGRAMRNGGSVIVRDIELDPGFAPFRAIAAESGFRAVLSTPLVASNGLFVGMISTHFARPHTPSREQMIVMDVYAGEIADTIQKFQAQEILNA